MALALNTTISGQGANSYVGITYCDDYWLGHYIAQKSALWAALTTAQKTSALVHACRDIEALKFTEVSGSNRSLRLGRDLRSELIKLQDADDKSPKKADSTQALQFPRNLDRDSAGVLYLPEAVLMAQCEQALYRLTADSSAMISVMQGVQSESVRVGNVSVSQTFSGQVGITVSPVSVSLLSPFLLRRTSRMRRA